MQEWLESLVPWGTEIVVWIQSLGSGADAVFQFFTFLGDEEFYLLLLPLVYWCLNREIGIRLSYLSLLSAWLNDVVKYLFAVPRPGDPRIVIKDVQTSPSFPSGHSQNAVVNWGYLALRFRNWILTIVAIVVILGISLSRMVLGVHYPQDILGGWLIGLLLLAVFALAEPRVSPWIGRQSTGIQVALAVGVPVLLIFLHPADTAGLYPAEGSITPMSALTGMGLGLIMERASVRFTVDGAWWRRGLRFLLGLAIVGLLYVGPKLILPETMAYGPEAVLRFVRYALLGWATTFLCPWLFVRLGLANQAET
jgi:membrane-associated phospholipid phosphatase